MAARKRRHDAYGLAVTLLAASGCMIGPDYARPPAPTAGRWIEAEHAALRTESADTPRWWEVFGDPVLGRLVAIAHAENLTLRAAGLRVLQAQARRGVAIGGLFPQTQQLSGSYTRTRLSLKAVLDRDLDSFQAGFDAAWEIDLWGRFRRAIEAADAELLAAVADYDDVLVSLVAEVATTYVQIRVLDERIALARATSASSATASRLRRCGSRRAARRSLTCSRRGRCSPTPRPASRSSKSSGARPRIRSASCSACHRATWGSPRHLEGHPRRAHRHRRRYPGGPAPAAAGRGTRRAAGGRAERPDRGRQGRSPAAFSAHRLRRPQRRGCRQLLRGPLVRGLRRPPRFDWPILNYGRITNAVRVEDATFQELAAAYANTVLRAQQEVEDAVAGYPNFLNSPQ